MNMYKALTGFVGLTTGALLGTKLYELFPQRTLKTDSTVPVKVVDEYVDAADLLKQAQIATDNGSYKKAIGLLGKINQDIFPIEKTMLKAQCEYRLGQPLQALQTIRLKKESCVEFLQDPFYYRHAYFDTCSDRQVIEDEIRINRCSETPAI